MPVNLTLAQTLIAVVVAVFTFVGSVAVAFITGSFLLQAKNREMATASRKDEAAISQGIRDELRKDKDSLRADVEKCSEKITKLEVKIEALTQELKDRARNQERAEEERDDWREKHEKLTEDYAILEEKFEAEQAVSALVSNLYESVRFNRPPDFTLLEQLDTRLRDAGYLSVGSANRPARRIEPPPEALGTLDLS